MANLRRDMPVNSFALAKAITRYALGSLSFLVFLLSVLAAPEVTSATILHSLLKAVIAGAVGYLFLLIVFDTVVKSIVASAIDAQARRKEGGLLFHFLRPDPDEFNPESDPENTSTSKAA